MLIILSLFGFLTGFFFIGVEVLGGRELSSTLKLFEEQSDSEKEKIPEIIQTLIWYTPALNLKYLLMLSTSKHRVRKPTTRPT